jgi:hypothetical protein
VDRSEAAATAAAGEDSMDSEEEGRFEAYIGAEDSRMGSEVGRTAHMEAYTPEAAAAMTIRRYYHLF